MRDVGFMFRQAPAHFASGRVRLQGSGAFDLRVEDLTIKGLRIESELRRIMPRTMASFARRLDDGKTFSARGNLNIGWSGAVNDPATCSWEKARVVFNDNSVAAGVPFDHINGEIHDVFGRFDGRDLAVEGVVDLASVNILGQHLTGLTAALKVGEGRRDDPQDRRPTCSAASSTARPRSAWTRRRCTRRRSRSPGRGSSSTHRRSGAIKTTRARSTARSPSRARARTRSRSRAAARRG